MRCLDAVCQNSRDASRCQMVKRTNHNLLLMSANWTMETLAIVLKVHASRCIAAVAFLDADSDLVAIGA